ncbi:MAG: redoxin domain-containing protein [Chloroflexota bacterium]
MTTTVAIGDSFPDIALPNQDNHLTQLSALTKPTHFDDQVGFLDGYPLIVVFYRGFYCPRDQQQMRQLVTFQKELAVNYGRLVAISTDLPQTQAAFRAGLGAKWPFLSDHHRTLIKQINILDETEGEYAYPAQPYTFILKPDLTIHKIYNGWFFVGRPSLEELRQDLRAIMQTLSNYQYEAYDTPAVRQLRIPQQTWAEGAPLLGATGLPVAQGTVRWFDLASGNGTIVTDEAPHKEIFFNFTAIPGEGYRTIKPGAVVRFETLENEAAITIRNIQPID